MVVPNVVSNMVEYIPRRKMVSFDARSEPASLEIPESAIHVEVEYNSGSKRGSKHSAVVFYLEPIEG